MKAIQTQYKGYNFRSRLEARWAVFFDSLGIKWEYEPEGFDLGDGIYYLPDFRIYGVDTNGDRFMEWFEVKASSDTLSDTDLTKLHRFGDLTEGVILLDGLPEVRAYKAIGGYSSQFVHLLWSHRRRPWWVHDIDEAYSELEYIKSGRYHDGGPGNPVMDLYRACLAARSARFEFGEKGATL